MSLENVEESSIILINPDGSFSQSLSLEENYSVDIGLINDENSLVNFINQSSYISEKIISLQIIKPLNKLRFPSSSSTNDSSSSSSESSSSYRQWNLKNNYLLISSNHFTNLLDISISNLIFKPTEFVFFCSYLTKSKWKRLQLTLCSLNNYDFYLLSESLTRNIHLNELELSNNNGDDESFSYFYRLFYNYDCYITKFSFCNNNLTNKCKFITILNIFFLNFFL